MGLPEQYGIEWCMDKPVRTGTEQEVRKRKEMRDKYGVVFGDGWRTVCFTNPVDVGTLSEVLRGTDFGMDLKGMAGNSGTVVVTYAQPRRIMGGKKQVPIALVEGAEIVYNPKFALDWLYKYGTRLLGWPEEKNSYLTLLLTGEQKAK